MPRISLVATVIFFAAFVGCDDSGFQGEEEGADAVSTSKEVGGGGNGADTNSCVPSCSGRECGSDGCGGQCGTCGNAQFCNSQTWTCETPPLQTVDADTADSSPDTMSGSDIEASSDVATGSTDVAIATDIEVGTDAAPVGTDAASATTDVEAATDVVAASDVLVGTDAEVAQTDAVAATTDVEVATDIAATSDIETGTDATASTTDVQAPDAVPLKPMTCTLTSLSKLNYAFHGGGVSSLMFAKSSWSFPMPSENYQVVFSTGDLPYVAFNMNLGDKWGYGADYSNGGYVLNGNWSLDCEGLMFQLSQAHFNTATCGDEMPDGPGWCVLSKGNDHRIVARLW